MFAGPSNSAAKFVADNVLTSRMATIVKDFRLRLFVIYTSNYFLVIFLSYERLLARLRRLDRYSAYKSLLPRAGLVYPETLTESVVLLPEATNPFRYAATKLENVKRPATTVGLARDASSWKGSAFQEGE